MKPNRSGGAVAIAGFASLVQFVTDITSRHIKPLRLVVFYMCPFGGVFCLSQTSISSHMMIKRHILRLCRPTLVSCRPR